MIESAQKSKSEEIMSIAELEDIIRQGDKEIADGNFQTVTIDDLWK